MADRTKIEWTDATWNPIRARRKSTGKLGWHCEHVTEACRFCYAEKLNVNTFFGNGLDYKPGHRKDIEIFLDERTLMQPLRWRRGRKIFPCSMTDLGADFVTDEMLDRVFGIMVAAYWHTYQVLTKRPGRLRAHFERPLFGREVEVFDWPAPNVWVGTSIATADDRALAWELIKVRAAVRFLSIEPLLEAIDISGLLKTGAIGWVICGGESGTNARPMHPDWVRSLRDQCAESGVPFHFKQWGEFAPGEIAGDVLDPEKYYTGKSYWDGRWIDQDSPPDGHVDDEPDVYRIGKKLAGRHLDGVEHNDFPITRAQPGLV
jgi:protein gp37